MQFNQNPRARLERNPLTKDGFYLRMILPGDHHRHFMVEGVIVSIDGENWHEVENVKGRLKHLSKSDAEDIKKLVN